MLKEHKQERELTENEKWEEIEALKEKNKEELADRIDKGMQEKAALTLINNDLAQRQNKKKELQNKIDSMDNNLKDEMNQAATKRAQLKSQKNDIVERETTIKDKDNKIKDLYKKTQDLEKFKFVLDYKIKELKREIGPRESTIQDLNEQTTKMRQEEKFFSRMSSNLTLIKKDLSLKQDGLSKTAEKLQNIIQKQEDEKAEFREAIFNCLKHLTDYKKLKNGIVDLHKLYVNVSDEVDDYEIRKKQAEQRIKNLKDAGKVDENKEAKVTERKRTGQQVGDADEHRK